MALDYINESRLLPAINKDLVKQKGQQEIVDYLLRLVRVLQEDLVQTYIQAINNILHITNVGTYYFDLPDVNGVYKDGDIRFIKTGGGVELQEMVSSVWTKIARWEY